MSEHTCHDPATEVLCRFSRNLVDQLGTDWHDCAGFRLEHVSGDEVQILFRSTPDADVIEQRDRYRAALERIADEESGRWGVIAHEALRGER